MTKKPLPETRRLNPEQQLVVDHLHGPLRVGAVAGSGKTHVLIERAAALVEKHRVTPSKILLISFSVNARKEMEKRLIARLPGIVAGEICRTFHSIGLDIFREEQDQNKSWFIDTTGRLWRGSIRLAAKKLGFNLEAKGSELNVKMVEKVASLAKTQMLISDRTLRRLGRIEPELKRMAEDVCGDHLADDALNILHSAEDIREITGIEERGMFQKFLTFDDMLYSAAMILRGQAARKRWAHRWTHVMQDEVQDTNPVQDEIAEALCSQHQNYMIVGDPAQCVAAGTLISTPNGPRKIEDLQDAGGHAVTAFRNGANVPQVAKAWPTGQKDCVTVATESGKKLTMSLTHRLWATPPDIRKPGEMIVYLMYRSDFGFRVGITNKGGGEETKWGNRLRGEGGERLWVLEYAADREEALLTEASYSLRFGIPTMVFNAKNRGLNQDRADALFATFGENGRKLLSHLGLHFDYPHWFAGSNGNGDVRRRVVRLVSHAKKGSQVSLEWTGDSFDTDDLGVKVHAARLPGGRRVRKFFSSHEEAESFAERLAARAGASVAGSLSTVLSGTGTRARLYTAAAVLPGMSVPVLRDNAYVLEKVVSVERVEAECFDLAVEDASNFYGNEILSHNCIFGFRGARSERILAFTTTWPTATTIVMDRNYRSGIEVIDVANRVIQNMPESTVIAKSMKCEKQTRAYVACHAFDDEMAEADAIARNIKKHFEHGLAWKDQAIVIRMNAIARAIEVALATAKVPYRIVSGQSFFRMTEASILLGYLRVASRRASLSDVEHSISNPSRMVGKLYFEQLSKLRESQPDTDWRELALVPQLNRKQAENLEGWQAVIDDLRTETRLAMTPHQALTWLVKTLDLATWLKSDNDGDNEPVENITQILAFAANYSTTQEMLDAVDEIDRHKKSSARLKNVVEVSTIHRYKGREASVVYMPSVVHGAFPLSKGDLLEERRLFYVGVTRAMDELWISYPQFGAGDIRNSPSMLLEEIGLKATNEFTPGRKIKPVKVGTQMGLLI